MEKQEARELLIKSKIYRFLALLFAGVGVIMFLTVYYDDTSGDIFKVLTNPSAIAFFVFPFIPSAMFALGASGAEKKLKVYAANKAKGSGDDQKEKDEEPKKESKQA